MKTTFRTMVLATAGVVGSVAVAHAQQPAPAPAAPAAPVAQGAPAAAPGTPTAAPVPGAPAPDTTTPTAKPGDKKDDKKAATPAVGAAQLGLGTPNPFRLSLFNWSTSASTKIFGVGADYQSTDDEVASMDFSFTPRYSFVNTKDDWAWVGVNLNWSVELTNSDTTTKEHQTLLGDLGIQSAYNHTFVRTEKGTSLLLGPRIGFTLPTSLASQGQGVYTRTSVGVGGNSNLQFHEGDWFNSLFLSFGGSWQHLFSNSTGPFNPNLNGIYRQPTHTQKGIELVDQNFMPSGSLFAHDTLSGTLAGYLTIYGGFSLGVSGGLQVPFRYDPTPDCVDTLTGCVDIQPGANAEPRKIVPTTIFDVSASYFAAGVASISLGYNNTSRQLGEDGQRRSLFYSPDSQFYLSTTIFLDGVYNKISKAVEKKNAAKAKQFGAFTGGM